MMFEVDGHYDAAVNESERRGNRFSHDPWVVTILPDAPKMVALIPEWRWGRLLSMTPCLSPES